MKKLLPLCLMLGTNLAIGEVIRSPIHSLDLGDGSTPHLVKFKNGRVAFVSSEGPLHGLEEAAERGDLVEARVNGKQKLLSIQSVEETPALKSLQLAETVNSTYEPTVIPSYAEAHKIFKRFNSNFGRASERSNRAHVWANEEFKANGIKSMKAFLFFTDTYIRRNNAKWWFHVAPMMPVNNNGKVENYVFDYLFDRQPVTLEQWKNNFVFGKRACRTEFRFVDYNAGADQSEDCYMKVAPMYYWMPADFANEELRNYQKSDFLQSEIRAAYSEAF